MAEDIKRSVTLQISRDDLSRLSWLCDKETSRLRWFAAEHPDDDDADDVAAARKDASAYAALAKMLRGARG